MDLVHLTHKVKKMSTYTLIKNARIVNEGTMFEGDVLIKNDRIERIDTSIEADVAQVIDANGLCLIPGVIDDQVHFREPGLTHKADIYSESKAAVAGGITSFMEMPNTIPNATTIELLEDKYRLASEKSFCNYSFYMGTTNDNAEEVLKINNREICGVKIFMGSSTGNMLVDNLKTLEFLFSHCDSLIAVHCEDEHIIKDNLNRWVAQYGENISPSMHPMIRSREACYQSSSLAIQLAKTYQTRLHVLHLTTAEELNLLDPNTVVSNKKITSEACVHHLYFSDEDYNQLGHKIKCNPAIKTIEDRNKIREAVLNNLIDVIATDHAPHTLEEKNLPYIKAPSGLPLVQTSLQMMISMSEETQWTLPFIVKKMSHDVADCFKILDRGFIREGYFADLVLLDPEAEIKISNPDMYYKCQWTPLDGKTLKGKVHNTLVNGKSIYDGSSEPILGQGQRLRFYQ